MSADSGWTSEVPCIHSTNLRQAILFLTKIINLWHRDVDLLHIFVLDGFFIAHFYVVMCAVTMAQVIMHCSSQNLYSIGIWISFSWISYIHILPCFLLYSQKNYLPFALWRVLIISTVPQSKSFHSGGSGHPY